MNSSLAEAADPTCTSLMTTCMPAPQVIAGAPPSRARSGGGESQSAPAGAARSCSPPVFASSAAAQPATHHAPAGRANASAKAANRDIAPFYHGFAARTVDNGAA